MQKQKPLRFFPYKLRDSQEECISFTQSVISNGNNVCLNASTGFGKTPAILAALLPYTKNYGRIIWAVRTGNETDRPIEELKIINKKTKSNLFGLSYRGKKDMCLLARDLKLAGELNYDDIAFLCKNKTKRNECKYYLNSEYIDLEELTQEPMLYSEILNKCKKAKICPYTAQRMLLPYATVVGLNYNYIINEGMGWSIRRSAPFDQSFLVVDEGHNLQYACATINSDQITFGSVAYALKEIDKFGTKRANEIKEFILVLKDKMGKVYAEFDDETEFDAKKFLRGLAKDTKVHFLPEEFDTIRKYGLKIRQEQFSKGKQPRSSLYHLGNFWLAVIKNLGIDGIAYLARKEKNNLIIEMWDMRAAVILKDRWDDFRNCIFCSGTLNPINAFAETIGLDNYSGQSFHSHYDPNNILALIPRGLSTKGEYLPRRMAERYVATIENFIENMHTNVAIFSASYRIQHGLIKAGLRDIIESNGRAFFQEVQGMGGDKARQILDSFKACANNKVKGVLCATATGRFAEGADFPGKELEGIFLVGIPFDRMSVKTKLYLNYYERLYGKKKGNYYAYIVPALRRAAQALGRALRSKEDRAVFVCGDERYADERFFRLLPDYITENAEVIELSLLQDKIKDWLKGKKEKEPPYQSMLEKLLKAVKMKRVIKIKYLDRDGKFTERLIQPYEIRSNRYVIGYCYRREAERSFRIDRIKDLVITRKRFRHVRKTAT